MQQLRPRADVQQIVDRSTEGLEFFRLGAPSVCHPGWSEAESRDPGNDTGHLGPEYFARTK